MITTREDYVNVAELSYEEICALIKERNITGKDIYESPLNEEYRKSEGNSFPKPKTIIESYTNVLVNGMCGILGKSSTMTEEEYFDKYIAAAKILFDVYYDFYFSTLDLDTGEYDLPKYDGHSYVIHTRKLQDRVQILQSADERVIWIYALVNMSRDNIRKLLYTEMEDERGKQYWSMNNHVGIVALRKAFRHPVNNIHYPITPTEAATFPNRLSTYINNKRTKANDELKALVGAPFKDKIRQRPYTCGYDLEYAFTMFMIYYKINGARYTKDDYFKVTQAMFSNFIGYRSHTSLKGHAQEYQTFLAGDRQLNLYEEEHNMLESYALFIEVYEAFKNIIVNNLEQMLQNDGARNLHGAIYLLPVLERGTYNESAVTNTPQEIKVTFNPDEYTP